MVPVTVCSSSSSPGAGHTTVVLLLSSSPCECTHGLTRCGWGYGSEPGYTHVHPYKSMIEGEPVQDTKLHGAVPSVHPELPVGG